MRRLRWQLTLSHLIAIAFTLVSMVAALAFIATGWLATQTNASRRPAEVAHLVALAIGGLVQDATPDDLDAVLRVMASGRLRLPSGNGPPQGGPFGDTNLAGASYIVVLSPTGQLLAGSRRDAFGAAEQEQFSTLAREVVSDGGAPVVQAGQLSLGAAPIADATGRNIAAVIVALPQGGQSERSGFFPLAFFGIASIAVLAAASVFALVASTVVGYFLSRRLVRRLEQLGGAAESMRGGDLSTRIPVEGSDEVSQLQQSFNSMASHLEGTLSDLSAERDRVTGLLDAQKQLVAGVSHELRTPVATVRGYLDSALHRDGALPPDLRADLDTAEREATRLEGLIDDLFTLSRAQVGRLELRLEPTDVAALVRQQVDAQAPLAWRQREVQVLAETSSDAPMAYADAQRVTQMVSNLLSNAVRHTPPGGIIVAAVHGDSDTVSIDVRDTGEGIPAEALPRVFERFYRGSDGGSGLGLSLVKELAESMRGSVSVSSTVGEGSTFSVRLPAYHPGS